MNSDPCEPLFCYGTLQREAVQLSELGRVLAGEQDRLEGYRMAAIPIVDPREAARIGAASYPAIVPDADAGSPIEGTLYWLTPAELARADRYEADDYVRRRIRLSSGRDAWTYVAACQATMEV